MSHPSELPHSHGPIFQVGDIYDPVEKLIKVGFDDQKTLNLLREKFRNHDQLSEFFYGSVSGLFYYHDGWLILVAVINHSLGNGHFSKLMNLLEKYENVRVVHLANAKLTQDLISHGYVQVQNTPEGTCYQKPKSPPGDQRERGAVEGDPKLQDDLLSAAQAPQGLHFKPD